MSDEMVTIPRARYEELLERDDILEYLEAAGIDNSTAYEEGMREYYADNPESDV